MIDEATLNELLQRRDLPVLVDRLNEKWTAEKVARERFYRELNPSVKSEFIQGQVVMHSPAKAKHLRATQNLVELLRSHVRLTSLGEVFTEKALICLTRNDYEPDIVFFVKAKSDLFSEDQMRFPAPDFIVEVLSDSTENRDRGVKFEDYADHGVAEYWIVDCDRRVVEQYLIDSGGRYRLSQKVSTDLITSAIVEDFQVPVAAIFDSCELASFLKGLRG